MAEQVPLGIAEAAVPRGSHICTFLSGSAQRDDVVVPFLAEGIRSGLRCVAVLESPGPRDLLTRPGCQVDLGHSVETGQLELPAPAEAYLRSGQFSTGDMLDSWREVATATQVRRASASSERRARCRPCLITRTAVRSSSATSPFSRRHLRTPGSGRLPVRPGALRRGGTHMDTLRTHPRVIADGLIHDNPYDIEPGKFLTALGITR
jgi:hypothetical protein